MKNFLLIKNFPATVAYRRSLVAARLLLLKIFFFVTLSFAAGNLGDQFITAKLAYGASIDVPKSWQVVQGNEMRAIETVVGAAVDLSGQTKVVNGAESLIVAVFPNDQLYAGVTVTSTSLQHSTRFSAKTLDAGQLREIDSNIRQGIESMLGRLDTNTWGWTPLKAIKIGETTVLHISYLRSSSSNDRRVQIYKFFGTGRLYDVVISTSVLAEPINAVVFYKIIGSFTFP